MSSSRPLRAPLWQAAASLFCLVLLAACATPAAPAGVPPAAATAVPATVAAQATPTTPGPGMGDVIPRPVSVTPGGGTFSFSENTGIYVIPGLSEPAAQVDELLAVGQYLADHLKPATGYAFPVQTADGTPPPGSISLSLNGADPALGDEGYTLTITPGLVEAVANKPAGLFYAVQTIRQLLPPAIDSASLQPGPWNIGTGTINDNPRFAWRGAMLDVARHFFSVREVTRYIDLLAYYKINRLHLHLADDQGWRIQINSWPNLALYGGSLQVGGGPGGYYSQSDYAYIVKYAQSRYITIIPEIDMPGHTTAALASYAELNCNDLAQELYTGTNVGFSTLCVNKAAVNTFLKDVIGELAAITPGPYIHVGGDEAEATSTNDYADFMRLVQSIVDANGKQMVGWEEIAQIKLLPGSIVQHWNLDDGMAPQAVQQGVQIIMSPADKAYIDMKYDASTLLGQEWAAYISVETGYSWDPATLIPGVSERNILGVEAPLWSETLTSMDDLEYLAFPRILGYAEMGWTPQSERDWNEYRLRLARQGPRLQALDVNFYASPEVPWP